MIEAVSKRRINGAGDVSGPLSGFRILSLAHLYSGPFATMVLADLGADVILVEGP